MNKRTSAVVMMIAGLVLASGKARAGAPIPVTQEELAAYAAEDRPSEFNGDKAPQSKRTVYVLGQLPDKQGSLFYPSGIADLPTTYAELIKFPAQRQMAHPLTPCGELGLRAIEALENKVHAIAYSWAAHHELERKRKVLQVTFSGLGAGEHEDILDDSGELEKVSVASALVEKIGKKYGASVRLAESRGCVTLHEGMRTVFVNYKMKLGVDYDILVGK
jgi:hypothetical protein